MDNPSSRVRVVLRTTGEDELRSLIAAGEIDLDCGGPRPDGRGGFLVTGFVRREYLSEGRSLGHAEVVEMGEIPEPADVGKGDRFAGGAVAPRGTGRKSPEARA